MNSLFLLIAQATSDGGGGAPAPQGSSFWGFMFPLLLAMMVFYFFLFRGQRKDRQRHADMLANLKRNDRVQTIGGVLGTVVDTREHEVVLKVDETNNVKMRFNRSAIKEVLSQAEETT
jgi:preprotein translocase subunit YajC